MQLKNDSVIQLWFLSIVNLFYHLCSSALRLKMVSFPTRFDNAALLVAGPNAKIGVNPSSKITGPRLLYATSSLRENRALMKARVRRHLRGLYPIGAFRRKADHRNERASFQGRRQKRSLLLLSGNLQQVPNCGRMSVNHVL